LAAIASPRRRHVRVSPALRNRRQSPLRNLLQSKAKRKATSRLPKKKPKLGPLKFPGFLRAQGVSTGLVVGADGWILTSRFVLEVDPTTILVTLADGRKFTAERVGEDRTRGVAMLKIQASDLPVPEYLHPDDASVGQWVFALGRLLWPQASHCAHGHRLGEGPHQRARDPK
jgi:S1-C subfamily serine protease